MTNAHAITHLDAPRLQQALLAGIANVLKRRDFINSINVFPVPDGDTGTNLAFTLAEVREALLKVQPSSLPDLLERVAEAALDGARGNSGAIMAQYFQGLSDSSRDYQVLDAQRLAMVSGAAAQSAWGAMSEPVPGTLPTVLEDFADELGQRAQEGVEDLREVFKRGLRRARQSLANTPKQLDVLRQAGVVDAGGQGFVDLLEGIGRFIRCGKVPELPALTENDTQHAMAGADSAAPEQHRFCTECLLEGDNIDVAALRRELEALDASSLVVAGSTSRARVHIHIDTPGDVFRLCAHHGEIRQQKADDMSRQHALMNQRGQVAVVTDSSADLPQAEIDRLGIHVVPVRLNFGEDTFLDKLTITPSQFYERVATSEVFPQTSQPPPGDFRRQFELLTSHGLDVVAIQISRKLSGTLQAAETAARKEGHRISVIDSGSTACGQALMVLYAAEAAANGWERQAIVAKVQEVAAETQTFALVRDLSWGVRGGRVKPWMQKLTQWLGLNIMLTTRDGLLKPCGAARSGQQAVTRFAKFLGKRMQRDQSYRLIISHNNARDDARRLRDMLLAAHPHVDACWIEEVSPAVGCHCGPGCLVVGLQPWYPPGQP